MRYMKTFAAIVLLLPSGLLMAGMKPFAPETVPGTTIVSAEQAIEMMLADPGLIVIDSRKKTEYIKGHIEGAISLLNTELEQEDLESIAPDRNAMLLFYCNGVRCLRSADAVAKAVGWGYTNVYWFRGGWKEWTEKRLPVMTE